MVEFVQEIPEKRLRIGSLSLLLLSGTVGMKPEISKYTATKNVYSNE